MQVRKAIKMRIYPNKEQQIFLDKTFGCCRFLYNQMLRERKETYEQLKPDKEALKNYRYKNEREYKEWYPFLKEVDSIGLQAARENLQAAFQRFFDGFNHPRHIGYPRFKSKKAHQSYTTKMTNSNIKIDFTRRRIKLPKLQSWIAFRDNRVFSEKIQRVTISKTKSGKYHASILIQQEIKVTVKTELLASKIVAFDMSAANFLLTESFCTTNPRFYRAEQKRLRRLHRWLSRKQLASRNREKARVRLACKYEQVTNRRLDWTHQWTARLASYYDAVILENLNIEGMKLFSKGLAKTVTLDFSWAEFVRILKYKLRWQGKHLQLVDRFFPSSKLCSTCGSKNKALKLATHFWVCSSCQTRHNRDINAARNLLREGSRLLQAFLIISKSLPSERREVTPLETV